MLYSSFHKRPQLPVPVPASPIALVVEQAFGTFKRRYGFQRARYVGRRKTELELNLIGMAYNLRKAIGLAAV